MSENGTATYNELANLKAALSQARSRLKTVRAALGVDSIDDIEPKVRQLTEAAGKVAGLESKVADLEGRAGKPDEKDQRIGELQGQIRQRDFRDAFRAEAAKAGVKPEHADKLLKLSDLTPPAEGDIGPELFADFLASAKEADAWAFAEPTPEGAPVNGAISHGAPVAATQPPPGAGRSASLPTTGQIRYSSADINTAGWQQSNPQLVAAIQAGTAIRTD